jgi:tetratricopeptide (TPR) repeat protein
MPARSLVLYLAFSLPLGAQTAAAHFAAGRAAYSSGNADSAVRELERAVSLDSSNAEFHLWLARAIGRQSETASFLRVPFLARRMRAEYERTVRLDSSSVAGHEGMLEVYLGPSMFGGNITKAREEADVIARLSPSRASNAYAAIARKQQDGGSVEHRWRDAVVEFPDSLGAVINLAELLASTRRPEEAIATVDRYLTRHPTEPNALFAFGRMSAITGLEADRGEEALRRLLTVPRVGIDSTLPPAANVHLRLGDILTKKGAKDRARREYEEALALNPNLEAAKRALKVP